MKWMVWDLKVQSRLISTFRTMLLGQISIHDLKDVSSEIWNGSLDSEQPRFYRVDIVGSMKSSVTHSVRVCCSTKVFFFLTCYCQLELFLKEPKCCLLLSEVYKRQQLRLQAIVDDVMKLEQLFDVCI